MISNEKNKPQLLLHICCAVCGGAVLERLLNDYSIVLYYFNPNIYPKSEYEKRAKYVRLIAEKLGLPVIVADYDHDYWLERIKGLENEPEKGARCIVCFQIRFEAVAEMARARGIGLFSTTLTVSPWKNAVSINEIGDNVAREIQIEYLERDDKKQGGYTRAVLLAKEAGIYQQDYCGCEFSKINKYI